MKEPNTYPTTSAIILISGYGTNLQTILDQIINDQLPIKIILVLSDNPKAYGIERAKKWGIPTKIIESHLKISIKLKLHF